MSESEGGGGRADSPRRRARAAAAAAAERPPGAWPGGDAAQSPYASGHDAGYSDTGYDTGYDNSGYESSGYESGFASSGPAPGGYGTSNGTSNGSAYGSTGGTRGYDAAAYGQSAYGTASGTQTYGTQTYGTQTYGTQTYGTESSGTESSGTQPYGGAAAWSSAYGQDAAASAQSPYAGASAPPAGGSPYAAPTANPARSPYEDVLGSAPASQASPPAVPPPSAPPSPMNGSPIAYGQDAYGRPAPAQEKPAPVPLERGSASGVDEAWLGASAPPRRRGRADRDGDAGRGSRGPAGALPGRSYPDDRDGSDSRLGALGGLLRRVGLGRGGSSREPKRPAEPATPMQAALSAATEVAVVLGMALALSLLIKTLLVQAFFIPSQSMQDTLQVGDRVLVSKLTPGPFSLNRGDVVVFKDPGGWLEKQPTAAESPIRHSLTVALTFVGLLPQDSGEHLIKRVIGLPGDTISSDGKGPLKVNGVPVEESYVRSGNVPSSDAFTVTVKADHLWVMGDNRSQSWDSRFHRELDDGQVPMKNVVGKAFVIVWPFDHAGGVNEPPQVFSRVPDAPTSGAK